MEGADGVNPDAVTYFAVPLVAIVGAAIARFQPMGMARALFVAAIAQVVALAIVVIVRNPETTPWTWALLRGFGGNAFLVLLFAGSALLSRRAGRGAPGQARCSGRFLAVRGGQRLERHRDYHMTVRAALFNHGRHAPDIEALLAIPPSQSSA